MPVFAAIARKAGSLACRLASAEADYLEMVGLTCHCHSQMPRLARKGKNLGIKWERGEREPSGRERVSKSLILFSFLLFFLFIFLNFISCYLIIIFLSFFVFYILFIYFYIYFPLSFFILKKNPRNVLKLLFILSKDFCYLQFSPL